MRRPLTALATAVTGLLVVAAPAFAADNGEGLAGETNDKVITFFCLGLVIFFTIFVILMSAWQGHLEKRKAERKAAHARQRIGW